LEIEEKKGEGRRMYGLSTNRLEVIVKGKNE
jgi:hypothetical protein